MRAVVPERCKNVDAALARFGNRVDRFLPFFSETDPLADEAVEELASMGTDGARAAFGPMDRMPPRTSALVATMQRPPAWFDEERCDRGGAAFLRSGMLGGWVLGFGSLPASFCSPAGNKPLIFTEELVRATARRLSDTCSFVREVSLPRALHQGGAGFRSILHVRLMHARIRRGLLRDARWKVRSWGTPISQADMAVTTLLFSWGVIRGLERLGASMPEHDADDLLHLWRCAGWLMGVTDELLCTSLREADDRVAMYEAISEPPDDDSRRLVSAMFDRSLYEAVGGAFGVPLRAFHQALCRDLIGETRANALGLPNTAFRYTVPLMRLPIRATTAVLDRVAWAERARVALGARYWQRSSEVLRTAAPRGSILPFIFSGSSKPRAERPFSRPS